MSTGRRPGPVHWVQAKKARQHLHEAERGRIVELDGNLLTVALAGQRRHYQIHDRDRVGELIKRHGQRVLIQERWSLLRLGNYLIAIRSKEPGR